MAKLKQLFVKFSVFTLPVLLVACSTTHGSEQLLRPNLAESKMDSSAAIAGESGPRVIYKGQNVSSVKAKSVNAGVIVPDGQGGVAFIESDPAEEQNADYVNARELKLKIRELAEQLIAEVQDMSLQNAVALPVSFVNLSNMEQSSALGRLLSEQLIYEFNQRGFPVKEYRLDKMITPVAREGEFYLTRDIGSISAQAPGAVIIAGTYQAEKNAIFVNARLIRPGDGRVLRTANLVLNNNSLTKRMLRSGAGVAMKEGSIAIKANESDTLPIAPQTPFDQGSDVH